ncbi:MAG: formylglycine-generating enzyme family protein [Hyphomicrobiaceae bacterium]
MKIGAIVWTSAAGVLLGAVFALYVQSTPTRPEAGGFSVGETFADCAACPQMVPVLGGTFHMGRQLRRREVLLSRLGLAHLPQLRSVDVAPFALSRTEVTFAQWDACVNDGGCGGYRPPDSGWGREARPVIHVSWLDAQAYVAWLSRTTGHDYRLPSEAEWEYAARAGTTSPYPWGRLPDRNYANFGKDACPPCDGETGGRDRWLNTAPVAQFPPNALGLHDMHGNVYEWTQDCFAALAPGHVSAAPVITNDCSHRAMRGGGWHSDPRRIQSDYRAHNPPDHRDDKIGFRVARTL